MNFIRLLIFFTAWHLPNLISGSKKFRGALKNITMKIQPTTTRSDNDNDELLTTAELFEEVSGRFLEDAVDILINEVYNVIDRYSKFLGSPGEFSFVPIIESLMEKMDYSAKDVDATIKILIQNLQVTPWTMSAAKNFARLRGEDVALLEAIVFLIPFASDTVSITSFLLEPLKIIQAKGKQVSLLELQVAINNRTSSGWTMKPLEKDAILNALHALKFDIVQAGGYGTLGEFYALAVAMDPPKDSNLGMLRRIAERAYDIPPLRLQELVYKYYE